jgi:hypothetical protein
MTDEQVDRICDAIRRVAYGTVTEPTGLELMAMVIAKNGEPTLSHQVGVLADAVQAVADAIALRAP